MFGLGWGIVGAPTGVFLGDSESIIFEAEVVAKAIGLIYADVCSTLEFQVPDIRVLADILLPIDAVLIDAQ